MRTDPACSCGVDCTCLECVCFGLLNNDEPRPWLESAAPAAGTDAAAAAQAEHEEATSPTLTTTAAMAAEAKADAGRRRTHACCSSSGGGGEADEEAEDTNVAASADGNRADVDANAGAAVGAVNVKDESGWHALLEASTGTAPAAAVKRRRAGGEDEMRAAAASVAVTPSWLSAAAPTKPSSWSKRQRTAEEMEHLRAALEAEVANLEAEAQRLTQENLQLQHATRLLAAIDQRLSTLAQSGQLPPPTLGQRSTSSFS